MRQHFTATYLNFIDFFVSQAALHGSVGDAEAIGGLALLGVVELIYKHDLLYQVTSNAAHLGRTKARENDATAACLH